MNESIAILPQSDYDTWDSFVSESSNGTLFHKSHWLMDSGMDFRVYGYFSDGRLVAGIPIAYTSKGRILKALHPPLTPYLGVVFEKSNAKYVTKVSNEKEICCAIAKKIKGDFDSISIKFTPYFSDLQPFIWEGFTGGIGYTYMLTLDDLDGVWSGMDAKRRNDITKAEKDGIYVERNNDFRQTLALVDKTFDRQYRKANFKSIAVQYDNSLCQRKMCSSFLAKDKDGRAIAAAYIAWDEKRSYYLLGGYDHEAGHHGASAMAIWEAIKFTRNELGLREFDFEGSTIQSVEKFLRKFGGKLTPCFYVTWMQIPLEITSFVRQLAGSVLRRLGLRQERW